MSFAQFVCGETASRGYDSVKKQVLKIKMHFIATHAYSIHTMKTMLVNAQR